jgi:uncharacterized membrane protein
MAGQKARAASGQGKGGGATTRNGSGNSGRNGNRTGQQATKATPVRDKNARPGGGQNGRPGGGQNGGRGAARPAGPQARVTQVAQSPAAKPAEGRFIAPPWVRWTSLVLSLAGLGVSIYLTIAHYTSTSILACSSKGYVDCAKVTTSAQSMVFGVLPVAVLGLAFYVFMTAANSPWGWRMRIPLVWWTRIGSVVVGMGFVLYLLYAEIIQIGNICLWCTSVHAITFLLFVLLVFTATLSGGAAARDAR